MILVCFLKNNGSGYFLTGSEKSSKMDSIVVQDQIRNNLSQIFVESTYKILVVSYGKYGSWVENDCLFFPDFIELYGRNEKHWDISMDAIVRCTPYATAEFAVRAFIIGHEKRMMAQMFEWTNQF